MVPAVHRVISQTGAVEHGEGMAARRKQWLVLIIIFLVGVGISQAAQLWPWHWLQEVTKETGLAFMIAGVLGATVDTLLKIELVRNAFFAAFQYASPPILRGEMLRILQYRLICESHHLLVRLEKIDNEAVRVTCEVKRKIENIGSHAEEFSPRLHIDEWGFKQEQSKIIECRASSDDHKESIATLQKSDDHTILFSGDPLKIKPGKHITISSKWSEIRRHDDSVYISFESPTINPEIEVQQLAGFKSSCSFGSASAEVEERFTGRQVVSGVYLPYHFMFVRWWRDTDGPP